jgi:nucleotide-binding universal stress UspA family protein
MPDLIALAIDGTPAGHGALDLAKGLAGKLRARVVVFCTIDAAYALQGRDGVIPAADEVEYPGAAAEQHAAEKIVADALAELHACGLRADGLILAGSPSREIVGAAGRAQAGLIVMGHRHLSWFDRLLHPSVCWEVLEHAHCPVLVSNADEHW